MRLTSFTVLVRLLVVCALASAAWALSGRTVQQKVTKKVDLDLPHQRRGAGSSNGHSPDNLPINALQEPPHQQQQQQQQQHQQDARQQPFAATATAVSSSAMELRSKRSQHDIGEYKDLNDILEDLEESTAPVRAIVDGGGPNDFDIENMPPLTYYLLLQKLMQLQNSEPTYRVRTPRLGRSIDFQLYDRPASATADGTSTGWLDGAGHHRFGSGSDGVGSAVTLFDGADATGLGVGSSGGGGDGVDGIGMAARQFWSRINKKSVPFKPRLGKRGQLTCN